MDIHTNLTMVITFIVLTLFLIPIYAHSMMNNTANTIENIADEKSNVDLNNVNKGTNNLEEIDSTELLNQIGEAAKKIAMGGANVLSNISGEIKKALQ
jgi:predicted PurR-regulated permease PerM